MESQSIKAYQEKVDGWIKQYGVRYFSELTNLGVLMEEVGELSRLMTRLYGDQSFKRETTLGEANQKMADEIADVLFVLTCIANQTGVDMTEAISRNFEKKTQRDKDRHRHNEKLKSK